MGNEKSFPSGLKVEETIKISDHWIQKSALLTNEMTKICIFEQHLKDDNVQNLQNFSKVCHEIQFLRNYTLKFNLNF